MSDFKQRVLADHGFDGASPSCLDPGTELCPGPALSDLFDLSSGAPLTQERIAAVLGAVPPYFSQAILSQSDPGDVANVSLPDPGDAAGRAGGLISDIRSSLDPPDGVSAEVVGLPVLTADANKELSGSRYWLTIVGLLAVGLVLVASTGPSPGPSCRSPDRAGHGLVGARARGDRHPAQPDVGDPRRPRDRRRDGVQRHPLGPVPRGAREGRPVGEALRSTYSRPVWRCSPPASPRSPGSACSPSAGSRCCGTSGSSRSSIWAWRSPA